jgi:hypothetical protein
VKKKSQPKKGKNVRKPKTKKITPARFGNSRRTSFKQAKSTKKKGKVPKPKKSSRKIVFRRSNIKTRNRTKKKKNPSVTISKTRGSNKLDFTFKNVRSISKKAILIKDSPEVSKSIDTMLKKNYIKGKGIKPPKGVVIIASDTKNKKGKVSVSPPDFVVNKRNIKAYVEGIFEEIENEYEESDFEEDNDFMSGDGSDENVNPDGINLLSIKFIY